MKEKPEKEHIEGINMVASADLYEGELVDVEVSAPAPTMTLRERAERLNKLSEVSQVALGMCLALIKDQKAYEPDFPTFEDYYKYQLGRSKGDVSKLLKVGHFMIKSQFPEETAVPYTKLYSAILAFPEKDPQFVLATAQTNTLAEIVENGREEKYGEHPHDWAPAQWCKTCGRYEKVV